MIFFKGIVKKLITLLTKRKEKHFYSTISVE